jgi:hypothetical protein
MTAMSSLLTPVGPQPARVYWLRRLLVLAIPVVLIAVGAKACSGSGSPSSPTAGRGSTPPSSSSSSSACAPGELSATLATSQTVYQLGQTPVFTATLTNISSTTCILATSTANENWTVTSGAAMYWTTQGCPRPTATATKSLAPSASRQLSITWNGYRLYPGCTRGPAATPGTFHLHATLDGVRAQPVTFHFTNATS